MLGDGGTVVALARRGADAAVRRAQLDKQLRPLKGFRDRLLEQSRGNAPEKLTCTEIVGFRGGCRER